MRNWIKNFVVTNKITVPLGVLLFVQFSTAVGQALYTPFIVVWLSDLGNTSYLLYSLISTLPFFVMFLAAPVWGRFSDAYHARKIFLVLGLLAVTIQYWILLFVETSLEFMIIVIICAIFIGAYQANLIALASLQVPQEESGNLVGLLSITMSLGWLLGSPLGGYAYDLLGAQARFYQLPLAGIIVFLAAILTLFYVPEPKVKSSTKNNPLLPTMEKKDSLEDQNGKRTLWNVLILVAFANFLINASAGGFWTFGFPYFVLGLGASGLSFSLMLVLTTALGIPTSKIIGKLLDKNPTLPYIFVTNVAYLLLYLAIKTANDPLLGLLIYVIPLYVLQLVIFPTITVQLSDRQSRSTAIGIVQGFGFGGSVLGSAIFGYILDITHNLLIIPTIAIILVSISTFYALILDFVLLKKHYRSTSPVKTTLVKIEDDEKKTAFEVF